jgi:hypothetical protein
MSPAFCSYSYSILCVGQPAWQWLSCTLQGDSQPFICLNWTTNWTSQQSRANYPITGKVFAAQHAQSPNKTTACAAAHLFPGARHQGGFSNRVER